jgi:hypothetical protein
MNVLSPLSQEEFEVILPLAAAWAGEQERHILAHGRSLTPGQISDAQQVGVAHPERVRLLVIPSIPMPGHPLLQAAGQATGLVSPHTAGLTLRYGIYIRSDLSDDRLLVAHELVHTAQYERHGSILAFLRQYLHECLTIGYPAAPLEQEAVLVAERLARRC